MLIITSNHYARYLLQNYEDTLTKLEKAIPSTASGDKAIIQQLILNLKKIADPSSGKFFGTVIDEIDKFKALAEKYKTHASVINKLADELENQRIIYRHSYNPLTKENTLAIDCPNMMTRDLLLVELGGEIGGEQENKRLGLEKYEDNAYTLYIDAQCTASNTLVVGISKEKMKSNLKELLTLSDGEVRDIQINGKIGLEFINERLVKEKLRVSKDLPEKLNYQKDKKETKAPAKAPNIPISEKPKPPAFSRESSIPQIIADFKSLPYFNEKETDQAKLKRFLDYFKDLKPEKRGEDATEADVMKFRFNHYNLIFMWMSFISVLVKYWIVPIKFETGPRHKNFVELTKKGDYYYFEVHIELVEGLKKYLEISEDKQLRKVVEESVSKGVEQEVISQLNTELREVEPYHITEQTQKIYSREFGKLRCITPTPVAEIPPVASLTSIAASPAATASPTSTAASLAATTSPTTIPTPSSSSSFSSTTPAAIPVLKKNSLGFRIVFKGFFGSGNKDNKSTIRPSFSADDLSISQKQLPALDPRSTQTSPGRLDPVLPSDPTKTLTPTTPADEETLPFDIDKLENDSDKIRRFFNYFQNAPHENIKGDKEYLYKFEDSRLGCAWAKVIGSNVVLEKECILEENFYVIRLTSAQVMRLKEIADAKPTFKNILTYDNKKNSQDNLDKLYFYEDPTIEKFLYTFACDNKESAKNFVNDIKIILKLPTDISISEDSGGIWKFGLTSKQFNQLKQKIDKHVEEAWTSGSWESGSSSIYIAPRVTIFSGTGSSSATTVSTSTTLSVPTGKQ